MNDQTDSQLLCVYAESRSEAAFAELVRRHVDFVYSAARRMVVDPHLAEDVTQGVFVAFAKNARQLADRSVFSGWLHRTAQNIAAQTVRTIERRRAREQEAVAMNELLAHEPDAAWENIAPHLDTALGELSEQDRDALLLRYFEKKSAREIAQALNVSEEAAQKRVNRAVERLREFFSKRNVTIGASGLVVLISTNAVQAAPVGLILTISSAVSLVGTVVQTSTAIAVTKTIAMTTLQKTLLTTIVAAATAVGIYEAQRASNLHKQIQTLRQEQMPMADEMQKLRREREDSMRQFAILREENERLNRNSSDLLKLRAEVARLRHDSLQSSQPNERGTNKNDSLESAMKIWVARVNRLKQRLEEMPEKKIPELQFLTAEEWLEVGQSYFEGDKGTNIGRVLSELRRMGKYRFANLAGYALNEYILANNDELPNDISQLKPYFTLPVDDTILERYTLLHVGKLADLPSSEPIIGEKAVVDEKFDSLFTIGAYGWTWEGTGVFASGKSSGSWDTSRIKKFMNK